MLAGPQGQGKSTMALQMCRNAAAAGCSAVMFSFELEAEVLLQRLISLEAGLMYGNSAPPISQIREAFDGRGEQGGLPERLLATAGHMALDALMAIGQYSDRLVIHRSTTAQTDLVAITDCVKEVYADTGQPPLIVVDYLQKVKPGDPSMPEEQQITLITQQLKDMAIDFASPVLALSSADRDGLKPGQRMRARHLKGSTALAYEPDVVMIMNTKSDIGAPRRPDVRHQRARADARVDRGHPGEEPPGLRRRRHRVPQEVPPGPLRHRRRDRLRAPGRGAHRRLTCR